VIRRNVVAAALCVALVLVLLPAARAQDDTPFGPVPTPVPTVEPRPGDDQIDRSTLYLIGVAVLVGVAGIVYLISRDARRSLSPEDRAALEKPPEPAAPGEVSREARARARKQRSKAKAARAARKRNR
jgi:hypothetical protein